MKHMAVQIENLSHSYAAQPVLELTDFTLEAAEHAAILGESGCGKSTLLHLIAGLLTPTAGRIAVCGADLATLTPAARDRHRGRHLGIVLQKLHLLPAFSVLDNLLLAQSCARAPADRPRALGLLEQLGLAQKAYALPAALSQGQAQRVAIARAILHRPQLILVDEPTSSLDDANAQRVLDLLISCARECGAALLVVTHDARIRGRFDRELLLQAPP